MAQAITAVALGPPRPLLRMSSRLWECGRARVYLGKLESGYVNWGFVIRELQEEYMREGKGGLCDELSFFLFGSKNDEP